MRRIFGVLTTLIGALMVAFAAITLLQPVWIQELYTRGSSCHIHGNMPAGRERDLSEIEWCE